MTIEVLTEELISEAKFVCEEKESGKSWYVEGVFLQSNIKNGNKRIYPREVLQEAVKVYSGSHIEKGRSYGELGHPGTPGIHLENVCIMTESVSQDGNDFRGRARVLSKMPAGKVLSSLLEEGGVVGVSSRGVPGPRGVRDGVVQEGFRLVTAVDVVADPSAPDAFVQALYEGKEWVMDNGMLCQKDMEEMREGIKKANSSVIREVEVATMIKFFEKLRNK